jgi:hypothetical protein
MKDRSRAERGQFSIIAALLMATILVAAVITTYAAVRNLPFQKSPKTSNAIEEMNLSIKNLLGFTVGRYGSMLKVTGNATYANEYVLDYIKSGLLHIARSHPEWSPSFQLEYSSFSALWFESTSYSQGDISLTYSLSGLGIDGIKYETSSLLNVTILGASDGDQARILVAQEEDKPDLALGRDNFFFYSYNYSKSTWMLVNPSSDPTVFSNGTYLLDIPPGVDPTSYMIQVVDQRNIMTTAFFSQSRRPQYTYTFIWDEKYENLTRDTIVVEVLQNGTLRWLGRNLLHGRPIPPISVKAFRINQTINGVNRQTPFQVENWASNYRVPLSLSSNESLFSNRDMIVFLANHNVSKVTLWWDGRDVATQSPYARPNEYCMLDVDRENRELTNGILTLTIDFSEHAGVNSFKVVSIRGTSESTAEFMRINDEVAHYGHAEPTYPVDHGVVRDVVQHEVEWEHEGAPDSPNVYAQIVLTLPANVTYYTYALRTIFVNSTQHRELTDLCPIQLSSEVITGLRSFTENGTSGGLPLVSETVGVQTSLFYNFSSLTGWAHHWSEYIKDDSGAGIMFADSSNLKLYTFDSIAGNKTGALSITTEGTLNWVTPIAVYDKCGEDGSHPATDAIDDNTGTYWRHGSTCNHWIEFDMGETMTINKIRIYQSGQSSRRWGQSQGIQLWVSDDPEDWGDIVWEGVLDASGWRESAGFEAQGRYIRLLSKSDYRLQRFYEIEVGLPGPTDRVTIEFSPVARFPAFFTHPLDTTWYGAVVTFDGDDSIWSDDNVGLWILVEYPPTITVD